MMRLANLNILLDPVLSDRIGPRIGPLTLGINRLVSPPLRPADLPPIDIIAISHPHFDHLDKPTLRALADRATTVVTARHTASLIPRGFKAVVELDWGERWEHAGVEFSAIRPRHWGARTAWDRHRGYNAYLMESARGRILCAGDTAFTPAFDSIGRTDLAVFGIGAYDPWRHAHATPEEVWAMARAAGASEILPVHHSTFELSDEPMDEPLQRLISAAGEERNRVLVAHPGEIVRYGRV